MSSGIPCSAMRDPPHMTPTNVSISAEMVSAGVEAYREFLGDDRPLISDENDLVIEIYCAMEKTKLKRESS
jgi:hypothetical protein